MSLRHITALEERKVRNFSTSTVSSAACSYALQFRIESPSRTALRLVTKIQLNSFNKDGHTKVIPWVSITAHTWEDTALLGRAHELQ